MSLKTKSKHLAFFLCYTLFLTNKKINSTADFFAQDEKRIHPHHLTLQPLSLIAHSTKFQVLSPSRANGKHSGKKKMLVLSLP